MPVHEAVSIKKFGNQIVICDQHQLPDSSDDVAGGAVALAAPSLRKRQFRMYAADPVDQQNDLGGRIVDIGEPAPG